VATLSVDVDQDYAAQYGVTMDRYGLVDCPVQKACAAHSGVTVEQTQNIVPPGAISSQPPELHD